MKSRNLTCTTIIAAACAAGTVHAVSLDPRGLGQVLLYPYYTVNKDQDTLVSLINTSEVGKAVKVRFLEGYNGRDVLEFFVFLPAGDVWTAAISQVDADSGARVATADHSCTFPRIPDAGQPFSASAYRGLSNPPFNMPDSGPQSIARTREGHVEVIADGDIVPGSVTAQRITQVQDGALGGGLPPGCDELDATGFVGDLVAPTSGLTGSASIVNVGQGTLYSYNADALTDFTRTVLVTTSLNDVDTLTAANTETIDASHAARATVSSTSDASISLDYTLGIDAVSAVLMADSINNDYLVSAGLGANTDWIVTFPTKRFYVDALAYDRGSSAPFVEAFTDGHSNVDLGLDAYGQDGLHRSNRQPSDGCGFLCPPATPFALSFETNAVRFGPHTGSPSPSGVFGSQLSTAFGPLYGGGTVGDSGWANISLNDPVEVHALPGGRAPDGTTIVLKGLPVTGFMVYNIVNANAAPGRLANYGGTFAHRTTTSCAIETTPIHANDPCS